MLPPSAYTEMLSAAGIRVWSLDIRRGVPDPRAILRLARLIRQTKPSVVHAFMIHANLLSRLTRLVQPMPVLVCSARSIYEGGRIREWAYRITDSLCEITTQVCYEGLERYVRRRVVPAHKILYIPNGIEVEHFAPDGEKRHVIRRELGVENAFVWVAVGRLEPPKDYPSLWQAFKQVVLEIPQKTVLLVVGGGFLHETLAEQAQHLGLRDHLRLLGLRPDVSEILRAADAYVMSSAWEGMSNALLEAAATALPIVATDVGGNREVVLHGQTGYLVPPRNPDALADAMLRLMNLPEPERLAMGQSGRQHIVKNFEMERIVDRWEQLYLELLERKNLLRRDGT